MNGYEIVDGVLDLGKTGLSVIEDKAFWSEKTVRYVIVPDTIEHIGDWAFAKCANLLSVKFLGPHRPGLFGKDVFKGCERLKEISFSDHDEVTASYMALCADQLPYDHLLRGDDAGKKSWYAKWDICLVETLKSDDEKVRVNAALCGEEDISYDGIGSVDGEMPGETGDFVQKEEFRKCSLGYFRLSHDRFLEDTTRAVITDHIRNNMFGCGSGSSFYSIFEEQEETISYLRIYLDITKPDRNTLLAMAESVKAKDVFAASYLIKEAAGEDTLGLLML
ncbi:MAG: leucine-rich repeat domain-containing protein [Lachnospiraceae bacterium]|nr:leucine-rich repeat domain-containing protein [Lachnospiraceae bacterium]